jgi:hypothetical protein
MKESRFVAERGAEAQQLRRMLQRNSRHTWKFKD